MVLGKALAYSGQGVFLCDTVPYGGQLVVLSDAVPYCGQWVVLFEITVLWTGGGSV